MSFLITQKQEQHLNAKFLNRKRPFIFQTLNYVKSYNLSLKPQGFTPLGSKKNMGQKI